MTRAVLGLDLGTSEAKAGLFDFEGRPLGIVRRPCPIEIGPDGRAAQDPAAWWRALAGAVRGLDMTGVELVAICGVGQGPTLAALDAEARPVRAAITWQDRRVGATGFGLLPRLAWLARADPDAVAAARWLLGSWDALGLWLTGRAATALQAHETPLEIDALRASGVDPERIPPPIAVGAVLGDLRPAAAERLGLPPGIPVVAGVNDGTASMLGAGLLSPGDAVDTGGASGGFGVYVDRPVELPGTFSAPAPIDGRWVVGGAMASTGAALTWLRDALLGGRWTLDELETEAAALPPGADGLIFLPYLAGERAPIFDRLARGAFVGLTLGHARGHLARAVLEAAAYAIRHVAEPILAAGVPVTELRLAGGPARSDLWARIKADVTGFPVAIPRVGETALLGAAILAAVGAGVISDRVAAVRQMTRIERRMAPDPEAHRRYGPLFGVYRSLYPALAPSFAELAAISGAGPAGPGA